MDRMRWTLNFGIALLAVIVGACSSDASKETDDIPASEIRSVRRANAPTPNPAETARTAEAIVGHSSSKVTPTEAESAQAREIHKVLQAERITVITAGMPAWVKAAVIEHEGEFGYEYAYMRAVAWGTGTHRGRQFDWFAYTNSDGWLQMDLSAKLTQADIDSVHGIRPGTSEAEEVEAFENKKLEVSPILSTHDGRSGTHLGLSGDVDWIDEFCSPIDKAVCDTAGAFEKYMLPVVNEALSGLSFTMKARIPR